MGDCGIAVGVVVVGAGEGGRRAEEDGANV